MRATCDYNRPPGCLRNGRTDNLLPGMFIMSEARLPQMVVGDCYGLNVYISPKFIFWEPNSLMEVQLEIEILES